MKVKNENKTKIKFAIFLFFALAQISWTNVSSAVSITAQDMINLTNKSRMESGLAPLSVNEKLTVAAQRKVSDMFKFQYFDHNSPSGTTPWDFIKSAGYEYGYAGENLAIDFISSNGAHKALMESSSHRENILNKNFTEIGIAVKEDIFEGNMSIIIVEEFASPLHSKKTSDYNLNENVELILEEKVNEINNSLEEIITENLETQVNNLAIENQNETELFLPLEEKDKGEVDDISEVESKIPSGGLENISALYFLKGEVLEKWIPSLFPKENFSENIITVENNDQKTDKAIAQNSSILSPEYLDKERVMGLVNEASFKETYLNKFKYQNSSSINGYFQDELSVRILMLDFFLAILLIFDFWFIIRVNQRNLMPEINL